MNFARRLVLLLGIGAAVTTATAQASQRPIKFHDADAGTRAMYSTFLSQHHGMNIKEAKTGGLTIVRFGGKGFCPGGACYTTAVIPSGHGGDVQVFARRVKAIATGSAENGFPSLWADGVKWSFVPPIGYVGDLKSAGQAFVPNLVLHAGSREQVWTELGATGWPASVAFMAKEITPVAAPPTLVIVPDMTTHSGQEACASGNCPVYFMTPDGKRWVTTGKTSGTGLLAALPSLSKPSAIGVARQNGFVVFSWNGRSWAPFSKFLAGAGG